MKKEYMKPNMKVLELKTKLQLLAGSNVELQYQKNGSDIEEYGGEFD